MTGISAIIITKNEERNLPACLASLAFVDEVVVVDSGSTDGTGEICRKDSRVRWYSEEWKGFGRQKGSAVDKASHPWVFSIDADERVTKELAEEIARLDPGTSQYCGYRVPRKSFFGEKWVRHCGWYPGETVRLFRKDRCRFDDREVHEAVRCDGPVGRLSGDLLHFTYRDSSDYVSRMNGYSSLAALELRKEGRKVTGIDLAVHPLFAFFKTFVLKRGFLDGRLGLKVSILYAFYTFYKYVKAWEEGRKGAPG